MDTVDGAKPDLKSKADADAVLKRLEGAEFIVDKVKKSVRKKEPCRTFHYFNITAGSFKKTGISGQTYHEGGTGAV